MEKNIKAMLAEIKLAKKLSQDRIIVGTLPIEIVDFLENKNVKVATRNIFLTAKGLSHLSRESKNKRGAGLTAEDIINIPTILKAPSDILFDSKKEKLNILYCLDSISCKKIVKIVIDTKGYDKKYKNLTLVKTAGYVSKSNLLQYETIIRSIEGQ